jgi:hypothetical protein
MAWGASLRQYNGAESTVPSLVLTQHFGLVTNKLTSKKETWQVFAAFCPFVRTSPNHCALLGRKRKYIQSKTTAKLIEKRTSIAAVPDELGQIDTFLTHLLSGCRLPLMLLFWCCWGPAVVDICSDPGVLLCWHLHCCGVPAVSKVHAAINFSAVAGVLLLLTSLLLLVLPLMLVFLLMLVSLF